jgi:hypothetical protein
MDKIQELARQYAAARSGLSEAVAAHQDEVRAVTHRRMGVIKSRVNAASDLRDRLRVLIEGAPTLFARPRTQVMSGIKCGYAKQRGKVTMADEAAVIRRIRTLLPAEQAELLVRVRECVHKPAVYDLTTADAKRLGIRIADDEDVVVIRATDTDIDKLVAALLAEHENMEESA